MSVTVVSYYTPTWGYPAHADRLAYELTTLGVPHLIAEQPDRGDYIANCAHKPVWLSHVREVLTGPLLWVDVDGSVLVAPEAFDMDVGLPARVDGHDTRRWHVGTVYLSDTDAARRFLAEWCAALEDGKSDEWAVNRLDDACVAPLPPEFFEIPTAPIAGAIVRHRLSTSPSKQRYHRDHP